jgi:hypothetical protein
MSTVDLERLAEEAKKEFKMRVAEEKKRARDAEVLRNKERLERERAQRRQADLRRRALKLVRTWKKMLERRGIPVAIVIELLGSPLHEKVDDASRPKTPVRHFTGFKRGVTYAHPQDPSKRWVCQGRRPRWIVDLQNEGHTPDQLQVS